MELTRLTPGTDLFSSFFEGSWPFETRARMRPFEADLMELPEAIVLTAELPGVEPDDVDVTLEGNVLTVSGEKTDRRDEENSRYHLFERRWGRFSRSFALPRGVDREEVEASFENGVLTIRIAKTEAARTRRIEIQSGGGKRLLKNK